MRTEAEKTRREREPGAKGLRLVLGWTLRLALVAACLAYVLHGVDWTVTLAAVRTYRWPRVAVAVGYTLLAYTLLGLRLHLLSRGELPAGRGFRACMIGLGLNNVLPAKLGELAKALYLRRAQGWPFATSLALVFWERLLDVNLVLVVALLAVRLLGLEIAFWPLALVVVGLWCAVIAVGRWPDPVLRVVGRVAPGAVVSLTREVARQIAAGLEARVLATSALATLAVWIAYGGSAWLAFVWIAGLPLGVAETLAVFTLAALGVAVPAAPGNLGVVEAAAVVALGWFGVSKSEALPIAVLYHLIAMVPTTVLGLGFLARADLGLRELWSEWRRRRGG